MPPPRFAAPPCSSARRRGLERRPDRAPCALDELGRPGQAERELSRRDSVPALHALEVRGVVREHELLRASRPSLPDVDAAEALDRLRGRAGTSRAGSGGLEAGGRSRGRGRTRAEPSATPCLPWGDVRNRQPIDSPTVGVFDGKRGLVLGVANKRSIAWAIAQRLAEEGAQLAFTYQGERIESSVRELAATVDSPLVTACDVRSDGDIERVFREVGEAFGRAARPARPLRSRSPTPPISRAGSSTRRATASGSRSTSAPTRSSPCARAAEPLMEAAGGGSILTMTYLGGERAVPHYNVMGVAKAALESAVRYLAWDLGEKDIRVNAVSAGPVRTLAARSIPGFSTMEEMVEQRSPLHRNISADGRRRRRRVPALRPCGQRDRDDALRRLRLPRHGALGLNRPVPPSSTNRSRSIVSPWGGFASRNSCGTFRTIECQPLRADLHVDLRLPVDLEQVRRRPRRRGRTPASSPERSASARRRRRCRPTGARRAPSS